MRYIIKKVLPIVKEFWRRFGFYVALIGCITLIGGAAYSLKERPRAAVPRETPKPVLVAQDMTLADIDATEVPVLPSPVASAETLAPVNDGLAWSPTLGQWQAHAGVDIASPRGETVRAALGGKVESAKKDALLGYRIVIRHADGTSAVYANLSTARVVREGDTVTAGQAIGATGDTARTESAQKSHLHFEYRDASGACAPFTLVP